MPVLYIAHNVWNWLVDSGFNLALLILLALLVPRFGRLAMRIVERKVAQESADESKAHLAFAGVAIYIAQLLTYFVIFVYILQELGFSLAGAAIPATAASAAIGLGAQSIIADFLAGFFVLSEKQYGVGDWVRFEGGATTVEGTVIQITMRATHIRTLAEETVIIPNSKAGVSINNSNYWSSAVVVMPIPLLASSSIDEAIQRATNAARRALRLEHVSQEILGDLGVHESVGINPPATVGSPWTVNIRFVVQVNPGTQWRIERAIRTEVIKEFWEEYGSAPTWDGRVATSLESANAQTPLSSPSLSDASPTPHTPPRTPARRGASVDPTPTQEWAPVYLNPSESEPSSESPSGDHVREDDARAEAKNTDYLDMVESVHGQPTDPPAKQQEPQPWWRKKKTVSSDDPWLVRVLTVGGRTRVTTAVLLLMFIVTLILRALTLQTAEGYQDGWLAPPRLPSITSEAPAPETTPELPVVSEPAVPTTTDVIDGGAVTPAPEEGTAATTTQDQPRSTQTRDNSETPTRGTGVNETLAPSPVQPTGNAVPAPTAAATPTATGGVQPQANPTDSAGVR